jgi:hypothetical protein
MRLRGECSETWTRNWGRRLREPEEKVESVKRLRGDCSEAKRRRT